MATAAAEASVKTTPRKPIQRQQQPTRTVQTPRPTSSSIVKPTTPNSAATRRSISGPSPMPSSAVPTAASTKISRPVSVSGLDQRRASQVRGTASAVVDTAVQCTATEATSSQPTADVVAGSRASQVLLNGDDEGYQDALNQLKIDALVPLIEDLADWLNTTLGPIGLTGTVDNFMSVLDTGVHLCKLSHVISEKATEVAAVNGQKDKNEFVSNGTVQNPTPPKYRQSAVVTSGSWFARDNTTNFINWCRQFGVKEECLFETEGLVLRRDPRNVVLCLLELARLSAERYGIEPPSIVRLEKEIELEQAVDPSTFAAAAAGKGLTPAAARRGSSSSSCSSSSGGARKSSVSSVKSSSKLDQEIKKLMGQCKCPNCYQFERLSEGRYMIGGKVIFIRLLRDRHVMVRVGGGWDSLEHYLVQHDPCKITEYQRDVGNFLHINSRYVASS